jgi:hypothetical protein
MSVLHHAGVGSVRIVDVGQSNLATPMGRVFEEK